MSLNVDTHLSFLNVLAIVISDLPQKLMTTEHKETATAVQEFIVVN